MPESDFDPAASSSIRDEQLAGLLQAAARGDARAFEDFYSVTVRPAFAVARRVVGDARSEDVLADCYFQAWRAAGRFDPASGSALTWLLAMARRCAFDRVLHETVCPGALVRAPVIKTGETPAAVQARPQEQLT